MKKTLLIAALTMMSASAFASKARMSSLGNSAHIIDAQTIFTQPADLHEGGDWATFETGPSAATTLMDNSDTGTQSEGGFVKSMGDAKWGFYLNHKNAFQNYYRMNTYAGAARTNKYLGHENPIDIFYGAKSGDMKWTVGFSYSNSENKQTQVTTDDKKQNAMGLRFGVRADMWDAALLLGLGSTANGDGATDTNKFSGTTSYMLKGGYNMGSMYLFADMSADGYKVESSTTTLEKGTASGMTLGVVDSMKSEGTEFFYGVSYKSMTMKAEDATTELAKTVMTTLPFILGLEHDANSWLVLRASVTQSVLLSSTKTDTGNGSATSVDKKNYQDTNVNVGAGVKFNKLTIDGSLSGLNNVSSTSNSATGTYGTNALLANASLTYKF